jgi:hypothetical protein
MSLKDAEKAFCAGLPTWCGVPGPALAAFCASKHFLVAGGALVGCIKSSLDSSEGCQVEPSAPHDIDMYAKCLPWDDDDGASSTANQEALEAFLAPCA